MGHDSMPRYVGLDVHKDSIAIAVAGYANCRVVIRPVSRRAMPTYISE